MRVLFWILLLIVFSCQERKETQKNTPDAVRDLLIDRSFWQKKTVTSPLPGTMSIHRFTITNTSQRYVYRRIKVRFDYYDQAYHKIDSATRIVEQPVEPRSAIKIDTLETRLPRKEAFSATATVVEASAN